MRLSDRAPHAHRGEDAAESMAPGAELLWREGAGLPLLADGRRQLDAGGEQLALVVAHFQKVGGVAEFPPAASSAFRFAASVRLVLSCLFAFWLMEGIGRKF